MFKFLKARLLGHALPVRSTERGASLLEYCLLLSTIVIIASTGISAIGARANSTLNIAQAELGGETNTIDLTTLVRKGASNPAPPGFR